MSNLHGNLVFQKYPRCGAGENLRASCLPPRSANKMLLESSACNERFGMIALDNSDDTAYILVLDVDLRGYLLRDLECAESTSAERN